MTIAFSQGTGVVGDSVSSISKAFAGNVTNGSLILIQVFANRINPVAGDITKSAGTATISAIALDKNQQDSDQAVTYFSCLVTGTGSLTLDCALPGGSYAAMGIAEFTGNFDSSRLDGAGNGANQTTSPNLSSGNATSTAAGLMMGGCVIYNNGNDSMTQNSNFASIFRETDGSSHIVGDMMYRIVTGSTTDAATWTMGANPNQSSSVIVIYKEAAGAGGTVNTKSIADTVTMSEVKIPSAVRGRYTLDSVTLTDPGSVKILDYTFADNCSVADSKDGYPVRGRRINDAITISEAVTRYYLASRTAADAITIVDSLAKACLFYRVVLNSLTLTELVSGALISSGGGTVFNKTIADAVALAETLGKAAYFRRVPGDQLSLVEVMISGAIRNGLIANQVTATDILGKSAERNRVFADTLSLFESVSRYMVRGPTLSDQLVITDSTVRRMWYTRLIQDAATLVEQVIATLQVDGSTLFDVRAVVGIDRSTEPVIGSTLQGMPQIGGYA